MASIRDQFERLRAGDRLYFRNRLSPDEIEALPTLSDLVKDAFGEEEMKHFPVDVFSIVTSGNPAEEGPTDAGGSMKLFEGDLIVDWQKEKHYIDVTLRTPFENVSGGYIGLGWNSQAMKGAEIWFCQSEELASGQGSCDKNTPPLENRGPFQCCVADGKRHVRPMCADHNYLTVLDSCVSNGGSYVTVRAQLCSASENDSGCFSHDGERDFIAAYHPTDVNAAHGFSRRTSGATNLALGTAATCSDDSAQVRRLW